MLTLGTDNGSAFTARAFKLVLSGLGIPHRRGGYRDPESQAFIESWFSELKERCVWLHEFETLDLAREVIAAYMDNCHDRPTPGSTTEPPPRSPRPGTMPSEKPQTEAAGGVNDRGEQTSGRAVPRDGPVGE